MCEDSSRTANKSDTNAVDLKAKQASFKMPVTPSSAPTSTPVHKENLFRVGDFCYFEINSRGPYSIRRIDEILKVKEGHVEVKCTVFIRRQELEELTIQQYQNQIKGPGGITLPIEERYEVVGSPDDSDEKEQNDSTDDEESEEATTKGEKLENDNTTATTNNNNSSSISSQDSANSDQSPKPLTRSRRKNRIYAEVEILKQRELLNTRAVEALPASYIRGKCYVHYLSASDDTSYYLGIEDQFFYSLDYDREENEIYRRKRGAIRVGSKYQCEVPEWDATIDMEAEYGDEADEAECEPDAEKENAGENDENTDVVRFSVDTKGRRIYETTVYLCDRLPEEYVKKFVRHTKAVGTLARAFDVTTSAKQTSVQLTAAFASRDCTVEAAMQLLHLSNYDLATGLNLLDDSKKGMFLMRDQLDLWSPQEIALFEEGLAKVGKNIASIKKSFLSWKTSSQIVEFYYMWKTTERYLQIRRLKANRMPTLMKQFMMTTHSVQEAKQSAVRPSPPDTNYTCFCCDEALKENYYPFGPNPPEDTPAIVAANARTTRQATFGGRLCRSCWLYWRRYACLLRPCVNATEKRMVRDAVKMEPERSVTQAQALATDNSRNRQPLTQPQAVKQAAMKLTLQQQQQSNVAAAVASGANGLPHTTSSSSRHQSLLHGIDGARSRSDMELNNGRGRMTVGDGQMALSPQTNVGGKAAFRTRVSICMEVPALSKLVRRMFDDTINASTVRKSPCKYTVTPPSRQDITRVNESALSAASRWRLQRPDGSMKQVNNALGFTTPNSTDIWLNTPSSGEIPQVSEFHFPPSQFATFDMVQAQKKAQQQNSAAAAAGGGGGGGAGRTQNASRVLNAKSSGATQAVAPANAQNAVATAQNVGSLFFGGSGAATGGKSASNALKQRVVNNNSNAAPVVSSGGNISGLLMSQIQQQQQHAALGLVGATSASGLNTANGSPDDFCWVSPREVILERKNSKILGQIKRAGRNPFISINAPASQSGIAGN